jgi:hypothetical protein
LEAFAKQNAPFDGLDQFANYYVGRVISTRPVRVLFTAYWNLDTVQNWLNIEKPEIAWLEIRSLGYVS